MPAKFTEVKGATSEWQVETGRGTLQVQEGPTAAANAAATAATTGVVPSTAPTPPCGRTQSELDDLYFAHFDSPVWAHFFYRAAPPHLTIPRCVKCGCTIAEHRPSEAVERRRGTATPKDLLRRIRALRDGRPLNEILSRNGDQFLASNPRFRTIRRSLYFHNAGRDLVAELRDIHTCPQDARRPVLMTTGMFGTGKTVLLLRALAAIPPAGPTLDVARVYITFDSTTRDTLHPGGRNCFNAALLLRVFHAALTTLGPDVDFMKFLDGANWRTFIDPAKYLPLLADALGVQTLAIAVDRITNGVRHQASSWTDLEAQTVTQLCDLFRWADIKRVQQPPSPRGGADEEAATAAVVIPILSCMHPRYARAAQRSDNDRTLMWLHADLAPCVNELVAHVSRPLVAARFGELSYRQQYAACGGHFRLCAEVYVRVADPKASPELVRRALKLEVDMLVTCLTHNSYDRGLAMMVAQAIGGMTFRELQERHGDAAAALLDPFFQSDTVASNIPLAVVLSPRVWSPWRVPRPLDEVFDLWRDVAAEASQQTTVEGMRKSFGLMIAHGLALRWAAFLAPTPPTTLRPTPPAPPPSVAFCAGRGAYLDPAGTLCWIELSDVAVCEPCTCIQVAAGTFPPPGGIAPNTYTLTSAAATMTGVGGGGCVAVSVLPPPFEEFNHVYFTVRSHQSASDADALARLVPAMPNDAPCLHVFWTPRPYTPEPLAVEALLRRLRSSRVDGAAATPRCVDVVAWVNVQDCLTPSLAWTLACAGVEGERGVETPH
jgi:hypothetical protein